jgi:hypothetical protein
MITQSCLQKGINDQYGIPTSKNHGYDEGGGNMISLLMGVKGKNLQLLFVVLYGHTT